MGHVNNDYINQSANTTYCKDNIHSSSWCLKKWHQENMCLLTQNMEFDITINENEKISNYIMCGSALSPMNTTKCVYPYQIYGLTTYALRKMTSYGMGETQFST
jgi:hypothetical protein